MEYPLRYVVARVRARSDTLQDTCDRPQPRRPDLPALVVKIFGNASEITDLVVLDPAELRIHAASVNSFDLAGANYWQSCAALTSSTPRSSAPFADPNASGLTRAVTQQTENVTRLRVQDSFELELAPDGARCLRRDPPRFVITAA